MKRALILLAAAAACVAAGGIVIGQTMHLAYGHAVYCALGTATTVGCDAQPADGMARLASAAVIITCVPLLAAAYGSLSGAQLRKHLEIHKALTVREVRAELEDVRKHVSKTVESAAGRLHERLDDHAELIRTMRKPGGK